MVLKKIITTAILLLTLIICVAGAGCLGFDFDKDYITTTDGHHYYYFKDDNGRSFYETIYEGDVKPYVAGKTPKQWIDYVQDLDVIEDKGEIFYNVDETIARGGGDGEDLSILLARGLSELGVDAAIIVLEEYVTAGVSKEQVDKRFGGLKLGTPPANPLMRGGVTFEDYYVIDPFSHSDIGTTWTYGEDTLLYEKIYAIDAVSTKPYDVFKSRIKLNRV